MCKRRPEHIKFVNSALSLVALNPNKKSILNGRYISLLQDYSVRVDRYSYSFHGLRLVITIGSLIVPALLSVQYTDSNTNSQNGDRVYWLVWIVSLFVTMSNGVVALLKIDKKYYTMHTNFQLLLSEGWQYIELSGKYAGHYTPEADSVTHDNQFPFFCQNIERIKMKQVEDEYYKAAEQHAQVGGHTNDPAVPATPLRIPATPAPTSVGGAGSTSLVQSLFSQQEVNGGSTSSAIRPARIALRQAQNQALSQTQGQVLVPIQESGEDIETNELLPGQVPVPRNVPEPPTRRRSLLQLTHEVLSSQITAERLGTEVGARSVEQRQDNS